MASSAPLSCSPPEPSVPYGARRRPRSQPPRPSSATLSSALTKERHRDHACRASRSTTSRSAANKGFALSPGRESRASSVRSTSSTILLKIQQWGASCFPRRGGGSPFTASPPAPPKTPQPYPRRESWDPGLSLRGDRTPRRASNPPPMVRPVEKPLRESEPVPARPAPAITMIAQPIPVADGAIGTVGRRKDRESTVVISTSSPMEDRFVWAQKYRPKALKEFICNKDRADELLQMVAKQQCSHFIFEGPPGVGKKTMVMAYLREAFGAEKLKTNKELKKIELKGEFVSSIDVNVRSSFQHVEVNLSDFHGYEKHVLASFINEPRTPSDKAVHCDRTNCRAIIIHEAEKLSSDAQHYLRWLVEKYKGCNKIFFCCSDASKLQIIGNLCQIVKLQPPSYSELSI